MKALSTNILANHPAAKKILEQYNTMLQEKGKVNNKKFYEEVIKPEIPGYSMGSWYFFLKRFKIQSGILPVETVAPGVGLNTNRPEVEKIGATMLSNQEATNRLLQAALNISAERARMILANPALMSAKDAIELGLKAMKAQDSRIHAIGKVHEDGREQEKFDRAFNGGAYEQ